MSKTKSQVLREITQDYLNKLDMNNPPSPDEIIASLLSQIEKTFDLMNTARGATGKYAGRAWHIPLNLSTQQIADIMLKRYHIVRVSCMNAAAGSDYDLLAIYQTEGANEGIYVTDESLFREIARQYNYERKKKDLEEVIFILHDKAPRIKRCDDKNLVAVNNGIFDYETKQLLPFSPDYVFLTKSKVNYNPNAISPVIHNDDDNTDWEVEEWMNTLSDDPEIVNLLWEIIGAIIRPNVSWNKSAWFYSEQGNNGKGTLCELMRKICGNGNHTSIKLSEFSKDFALEPLIHTSAIIVDENDVGTFVDKAADLKAIITGDMIMINRKFKQPIAYQFHGFMVQCLNEMPRIKDKSNSFYRRQLFVPFNKNFEGVERKYIKDNYLKRQDVLEYVLWRVLNMNYYSLSEPLACQMALNQYKEFNDPVRQFFTELEDLFVWDLLPFDFLYDLYKAWFAQNSPGGGVLGKITFNNYLVGVASESSKWLVPEKGADGKYKRMRPGKCMDNPEPLIKQYNLTEWMNPVYRGNDEDKLCVPLLKTVYRGLVRATMGGKVIKEEVIVEADVTD